MSKQRNVLLAAAALLAAATLPGSAQIRVDFNEIKCSDYFSYAPEQQIFIRFWLSGYYSAAANNKVLDYSRLQRNSAKVAAYCKTHKSDTLPTAIQKAVN